MLSDMPALLAALRDNDYRIAAAAIDKLADMGNPAVVPALLDILHERQLATIGNDVRTGVLAWRAVCALSKLGNTDLVPNLVAASYDEFSLLRGAVVSALTGIGLRTDDVEARALITRTLTNFQRDHGVISAYRRWRVCDEAAKGLQRIAKSTSLLEL
jgi:HEAT repeat protein